VARLPQPKRGIFTDPEELAAYDHVTARMSTMLGSDAEDPELEAPSAGDYFGALLNSPKLTQLATQLGTFVRAVGDGEGSYSHADREFVDQVLSVDWQTNVVQGTHVPDAISTGVRLEAIEALRSGDEPALTDDEQLLARYIRQVVSGTDDDETFARMHDRLGARGLVEYTGFILWLQWIIRMMQTLDTDAVSDEEIERILAGIKDGSIEVPNFRERIH
jgi:hypothetical protein